MLSIEIKVKQTENKFSSKKDTGNHLKYNFSRDVNKKNRFKEKEIKVVYCYHSTVFGETFVMLKSISIKIVPFSNGSGTTACYKLTTYISINSCNKETHLLSLVWFSGLSNCL